MVTLYVVDEHAIKRAYNHLTGREMPKFAINRVMTEFRKYWESKIDHTFSVDGIHLSWYEPDHTGYSPVILATTKGC